MKKISVIVPVYNVSDYLAECLDSIINQDYKNYEIIVVNDGSTDNSLEIAKKYEKDNLKKVKVFDKKNGGLSSARNYGIKKSTGDYLLFVDSDDCLLPGAIKKLGDIINKEECDIVVYSFMEGVTIDSAIYNRMYDDTKELANRYIIGKPCAPNKLCKKSLFIDNKIEFPEGLYYEDLATMPKLILHTDNIKFITDALYFYRRRDTSIMNKMVYNKKMDSIFTVMEELRNYFKDQYHSELEYLHIEHLLRGASIRYIDCGYIKESLDKIVDTIRLEYPNWRKNKYLKKDNIKKRIMCALLYKKQYKLIKILRR